MEMGEGGNVLSWGIEDMGDQGNSFFVDRGCLGFGEVGNIAVKSLLRFVLVLFLSFLGIWGGEFNAFFKKIIGNWS